jgi:hypothetical protein
MSSNDRLQLLVVCANVGSVLQLSASSATCARLPDLDITADLGIASLKTSGQMPDFVLGIHRWSP